jgi:hypothetical protein
LVREVRGCGTLEFLKVLLAYGRVPFARRNNVELMTLNSTQAFDAHRRNVGHLVSVGQDLARTAGKTHEMALASAQTIGYRTAMMLQAFGDPVAMANPEFTLMGHEKVEAAVESHRAMMESGQALFESWMTWAFGQANNTTKAFAELATCRTPADIISVQQHYLQSSWINATTAAAKLAQAAIRITDAGLIPVHKVASANAKRLSERNG